ncbi:sigma-70 family RNA polymerase sigma factor [Leucobacter chromiiresistens]
MGDGRNDSDERLLAAYRAGDAGALATLWQRHVRPALAAARSLAPSLDAEDVVADAYLRIIESIEHGRGPHGAFRPYLYRVVRSVAADKLRDPHSHASELDADHRLAESAPWEEDAFDRDAAARAFNSLNERWQAVLWYTEVEGLPPREAARLLGLQPNAVSALAARARDALASAWVEAHVNREFATAECEATLRDLQRYQRGRLPSAKSRAVRAHLETCRSCAAAAEEVATLNRRLALILATIFVGGGAPALLDGFTGSAPAAASTGGVIRRRLSSSPVQTAAVAGATVIGIGAVVAAALALSAATPPVVAADTGNGATSQRSSGAQSDASRGGAAEQGDGEEEDGDGSPRSDPIGDSASGGDGRAFVEIPVFERAADPRAADAAGPQGSITAGADMASAGDGDSSGAGSSDGSASADAAGDADASGAADAGADPGAASGANAEAEGSADGGPIDDSDPTLLVGFSCFAENPQQGFVLTGTASTAGALQARVTQPPSIVPVPLIAYPSVTDQSGATYENVFSGTDPDPDPWWWTPSLTPLSQWDGLHDGPVGDVIIEMRLLTPDGRHSPWTTVVPQPAC